MDMYNLNNFYIYLMDCTIDETKSSVYWLPWEICIKKHLFIQ